MGKILIVYSTNDGQTLRICERLKQVVEARAHAVNLVAIRDVAGIDLQGYDRIVVGAAIRYGKHSPLVADFVRRNRAALESRTAGFFSVNLVARKPEKNRPETNPYVRKFLRRTGWNPPLQAVFAGKVNYPIYSAGDRLVIRLIMWMTKGPTAPDAVIEFTDWDAVEAFGRRIAA